LLEQLEGDGAFVPDDRRRELALRTDDHHRRALVAPTFAVRSRIVTISTSH
jgi:hypothetical protein